jgi:hypothetical protein
MTCSTDTTPALTSQMDPALEPPPMATVVRQLEQLKDAPCVGKITFETHSLIRGDHCFLGFDINLFFIIGVF